MNTQRIRAAQRLDVDEVPQRVLEVVHAVDERHVERASAQKRRHVLLRKEVISWSGQKFFCRGPSANSTRGSGSMPSARVSGRTSFKGFPARHADFQIGCRLYMFVCTRASTRK